MKTIKVIDLLNKIANGETPPKKIRYDGKKFIWVNRVDDIFNYKETTNEDDYYNEYFEELYMITNILNEKVEIIEEDKKIEKLEIISSDSGTMYECIANKINEIIEVLNEK